MGGGGYGRASTVCIESGFVDGVKRRRTKGISRREQQISKSTGRVGWNGRGCEEGMWMWMWAVNFEGKRCRKRDVRLDGTVERCWLDVLVVLAGKTRKQCARDLTSKLRHQKGN